MISRENVLNAVNEVFKGYIFRAPDTHQYWDDVENFVIAVFNKLDYPYTDYKSFLEDVEGEKFTIIITTENKQFKINIDMESDNEEMAESIYKSIC